MNARETTHERDARFMREMYAAMRALITDEMRNAVSDAAPDTVYPAGEIITTKAGHRTITIDEGEVWRLALADNLKTRGYRVISNRCSFGLFAGRKHVTYGVGIAS